MTTVLTPTQMFLLRRIGDGIGLPASLPGERKCTRDVGRLCSKALLSWNAGELLTTVKGRTNLDHINTSRSDERFGGLCVVHGHDRSIIVEYRPAQE